MKKKLGDGCLGDVHSGVCSILVTVIAVGFVTAVPETERFGGIAVAHELGEASGIVYIGNSFGWIFGKALMPAFSAGLFPHIIEFLVGGDVSLAGHTDVVAGIVQEFGVDRKFLAEASKEEAAFFETPEVLTGENSGP